MTYRRGEIIVATDFNTFRAELLNVYDVGFGTKGYGQIATGGAPAIPLVAVGDKVQSAEWTEFTLAGKVCSVHQGTATTFPPVTALEVGDIVQAHSSAAGTGDSFDIESSLIAINARSLLFNPVSMTYFANTLLDLRNTVWSNQLQHRFTATFPTVDDARYFFNSGGDIRIGGSRTGGSSTPQNTSWSTILSNMGRVVMRYDATFVFSGGTGWIPSPIGYYDLTTSFQRIAYGDDASAGPYYGGGNHVTIEARTVDGPGGANGDRGRNVEFRILYTDASNNPFADEVDGTITSNIDYMIATSPLTIQTPIFSTSVSLASGT